MTILTDGEIHNSDPNPHQRFDKERIDFARAIESAVIAKLAACEMPSREHLGFDDERGVCIYGYTADQMRQAVAQARAKDSVDAERYWWIRQYLPSDDVGCNEAIVSALTPEEIDAAIDAAREVK